MSELLSRAELEMIKAWEQDKRYERCSPTYLRVIRDKIYAMKGATKYDKSLIQYWLMKKEGRLDEMLKSDG